MVCNTASEPLNVTQELIINAFNIEEIGNFGIGIEEALNELQKLTQNIQ